MSYPSLEAIRANCPVVSGGHRDAAELIVIIRREEYEPQIAWALCSITTETKTDFPGCAWGCRNVTSVDPNGCPLRDASAVKVFDG